MTLDPVCSPEGHLNKSSAKFRHKTFYLNSSNKSNETFMTVMVMRARATEVLLMCRCTVGDFVLSEGD